ncbi:serine protease [Paenibacillus albidus]|uniref:CAP domain-containing protein n=1 Tax=Paenibacillus albidus TaxID=2041023 RepID=UPI001BEC44B4|nr:CAP domain-containing protein [Paenibacillus albidus]MBT2293524.1 serine protease [Paenibacillus albidus]
MKSKTLRAMIGGSVAAVMALGISIPMEAKAAPNQAGQQSDSNYAQFLQFLNQYNLQGYKVIVNGKTIVVNPQTGGQQSAAPAAAPAATPAPTAAPAATPAPTAKPAATAKPATTGSAQTNSKSSYIAQVVALVNKERATAGLSPVTALESLNKVAGAKATDMRVNNYFSHTSPTYGSPFDMMKSFGVTYSYAGENIAMGQKTPQEVMTAWMNSQGHRANILSANFNYIGVGFDNNYWVQEFIGK